MKTKNAIAQKKYRSLSENVLRHYEQLTGIDRKTMRNVSRNKPARPFKRVTETLLTCIISKMTPVIVNEGIDMLIALEEKASNTKNPWDDIFFSILKAIVRKEKL